MVRRKNRLTTDAVREVRNTFSRFLSILILSALAVAFLAGLRATAPDMQYTADAYYDRTRLMDGYVISTLGLTDEDLEALAAAAGVGEAEGVWSVDAVADDAVVSVISLPQRLNLLELKEGRMPEAADECVTERLLLTELGLKVGDRLALAPGKDHEGDLTGLSYTITGVVSSPLYVGTDRGTSSLGSGSVDGFVYVPAENFDLDYYTMAYFTGEGFAALNSYGDEYDEKLDALVDSLDGLADERARLRYASVVGDAQAEIDEAQAELDDAGRELADARADADRELADAEAELADARRELDDGWRDYQEGTGTYEREIADAQQELLDARQELLDAEAELADGKQEYADGLAEYQNALEEYEDGLEQYADGKSAYQDGEAALSDGEDEYYSGVSQYNAGRKQYEEGLASYEAGVTAYETLDAQQKQLDEADAALSAQEEAYQKALEEYEKTHVATPGEAELPEVLQSAGRQLKEQRSRLEMGKAQLKAAYSQLPVSREELAAARAELEDSQARLSSAESELEAAWREIEDGRAQLSSAWRELIEAERELSDGKKELDDAWEELEDARFEIEDGEKEIADGWNEYHDGERELEEARADGQKELDDALAKLNDGEREYADGLAEYEDGRAEARQEIADAQKKLDDAQAEVDDARSELDDIDECEWYVLGRNTNAGFEGYGQDSERISNLADIFPIIFFLVAALACLTTMTRMVEEQRTQIGALKAMGFSRLSISKKYIGYALAASLLGGVLGLALGGVLIPEVIANAFNIMYDIPALRFKDQTLMYAACVLAAVACTTGAALWACLSTLVDTPANLMRPRAPKAGKRVFLEYIRPLWSRLSFTWKVTMRNLFRYKRRFWMTVVGIGGCTALIVTGFGLHDSIFSILNRQFDEIAIYDATVGLDVDAALEELLEAETYLDGSPCVERYLISSQSMVSASCSGPAYDSGLFAVDDMDAFGQFINLRHRLDGAGVTLPASGVIITEKLSELLGAGPGDVIILEKDDERVQATVSDVVENYVQHYLYVSYDYYEELFGREPEENVLLIRYVPQSGTEQSDQVSSDLMAMDAVTSYSYIATIRDSFTDSMVAIDYAVVIIITAAAALAFVVLYNLTNINITERTRELATLKVLGFYDREITAYVYRENIFLTIFGILLGLVLGRLLHSWLVLTVEVDMVMFGRTAPDYAYWLAVALTAVFSVVVNIAAHFKLKKVDMVESLKTVE